MSNRHRILEVIGLVIVVLLLFAIPTTFGIMVGLGKYHLACLFGLLTIVEAVATFLCIGESGDIIG